MVKPHDHCRLSVKKWGGKIEDYLPIHDMMDSTKIAHGTMKHRVVFHSTFGCFLIEKLFGHTITNSDDRVVHVRDIAESHIIQDHGFIPSLDDWCKTMTLEPWMGHPVKVVTEYKLKEESHE
jgi:hypothetical protein